MKKLFVIFAAVAAAFVSCEKEHVGSEMSESDIVKSTKQFKKQHKTTSEDFDVFLTALCKDIAVITYSNRLIYNNGKIETSPVNELVGGGLDHSLMSGLLFFEDGICWQWQESELPHGINDYCPLEWTADRKTQTIKLVSPCLKAKGGEHAETELKLVAFGKHP